LSINLTTILADYVKSDSLAKVAKSNSYNDLDDLPTIPTVTNDLTDDLKKDYDEAVIASKHDNRTILDSFGKDVDGNLTYNGTKVIKDLGDCLTKDDIVDNLTSTDTDKPLSAYQGKLLKDDIEECFQSASDGKKAIAIAITGKGVATNDTDTYQTMATNISNIQTSIDSSMTTAEASDLLQGKTAISKGEKIIGTIVDYSDDVYTSKFSASSDYYFIKNPKGYFKEDGIK
jgi:hypothetical protein